MDELPSIIEDGKYIVIPKGEEINELVTNISNLNVIGNIDYFLVENSTITFRVLEGENINFYARDFNILVEELDFKA